MLWDVYGSKKSDGAAGAVVSTSFMLLLLFLHLL